MKSDKNMSKPIDKNMGIRSQTCMKFNLLFDSNDKFVNKRPYIEQYFRQEPIRKFTSLSRKIFFFENRRDLK